MNARAASVSRRVRMSPRFALERVFVCLFLCLCVCVCGFSLETEPGPRLPDGCRYTMPTMKQVSCAGWVEVPFKGSPLGMRGGGARAHREFLLVLQCNCCALLAGELVQELLVPAPVGRLAQAGLASSDSSPAVPEPARRACAPASE